VFSSTSTQIVTTFEPTTTIVTTNNPTTQYTKTDETTTINYTTHFQNEFSTTMPDTTEGPWITTTFKTKTPFW
jgi:hypothetical protein